MNQRFSTGRKPRARTPNDTTSKIYRVCFISAKFLKTTTTVKCRIPFFFFTFEAIVRMPPNHLMIIRAKPACCCCSSNKLPDRHDRALVILLLPEQTAERNNVPRSSRTNYTTLRRFFVQAPSGIRVRVRLVSHRASRKPHDPLVLQHKVVCGNGNACGVSYEL